MDRLDRLSRHLSPPHPPLPAHRLGPTLGAEIDASSIDMTSLNPSAVARIDQALLQHKVLMFRGLRGFRTEHQLALIQALNARWGLGSSASLSPQQQYNYKDGAFVIRMLASKKGTEGRTWQVSSIGGTDRSSSVPATNPAARSPRPAATGQREGSGGSGGSNDSGNARDCRQTTRTSSSSASASASSSASSSALASAPTPPTRLVPWPFTSDALLRAPPSASSAMGRFHLQYGGTGNWVRRHHETTNATNVWHSDDNYVLEPPWVTTLAARHLPSCGGDTVFSDMGAAFDDLAPSTQGLLCGLGGVADWKQVFPHYGAAAEATGDDTQYMELRSRYPRIIHPLVRTHPSTGARVVYANAIYTTELRLLSGAGEDRGQGPRGGIGDGGSTGDGGGTEKTHCNPDSAIFDCGDDAACRSLMRDLFALPNVPEYQCRVSWKSPGDFVMWDNRACQHYAVADYGGERDARRVMEHMASLGDRPFLRRDDGVVLESRFLSEAAYG